TSDVAIQRSTYRDIASERGSAYDLDTQNGDNLALVSSPAYDPNVYIPQLTPEENRKLNDETLRPQVNRATQDNYRPGSVFKIVVALACLEAGLDPEEKIKNLPNPVDSAHGHIVVRGRTVKDTAPPGEYDFRRAFIRSCNTYFITNGLRYGVQNIARIGERLHLGERTGLPTRQEVAGRFPTLQTMKRGWSQGESANLCIGQGAIDVTPLQMTVMIGAIANGGKELWPRLVDRIEPQGPFVNEVTITFPRWPPRGD